MAFLLKPYAFNLASKSSWLRQSKALDKSIRNAPTKLLLSKVLGLRIGLSRVIASALPNLRQLEDVIGRLKARTESLASTQSVNPNGISLSLN